VGERDRSPPHETAKDVKRSGVESNTVERNGVERRTVIGR